MAVTGHQRHLPVEVFLVLQVSGGGPQVTHVEQEIRQQLLLDSEIPLLDSGIPRMGIDDAESGIGDDSGRAREKLVDDAEFPASGGSYYRSYRDIPGHVKPRIGDRRCVENSSPGAEHCLVVSPSWRP